MGRLRKELNTIGSLSKVYRWRDADGNQHFSDRPPEQAAQVKLMEINPDANLILGLDTTGSELGMLPKQPATLPAIGNSYKPERIKQLFDDAKQIQRTLNQRYQSQQEILQR